MKKNGRFYIGVICTMIDGMLSGCNFILLYPVFQQLLRGQVNFSEILKYTWILAAVFLFRMVVYTFGYVQGQYGGAQVSRNARIAIGEKLKKVPLKRFNRGQVGEYINVSTSDINNYETILTHKTGGIIKNITLSCMVVCFAGSLYLPAGIIMLAACLTLIPAMWASAAMVKKYGNQKNRICAEAVSSIVEYITGIQTLRAYGMAGIKNQTVTADLENYSDISYRYERKIIPTGVIQAILAWMALPLTIYLAFGAWSAGDLETVSFLILCCLPLFLVRLTGVIFVDLTSYKNSSISRNRILGILDEEEERSSGVLETAKYPISFEGVSFSYKSDEKVLADVSFTAPDGELTAIVGDSGSGKSTVLNLISKYYEPQKGSIFIGSQEIGASTTEQVLKQVSIVDQEVFLFNDTVRDNIRYARPDASDAEVEQACREANCGEFIQSLEMGYDTVIGENGNQLSGGERQRLSIARAILKNSPILLLDEATASLDIENELAVKEAIVNLLKQRKTVIMIAHTLSIIRNADQILVIDGRKIAESGTHEELIKRDGKYAAMWKAEQELM